MGSEVHRTFVDEEVYVNLDANENGCRPGKRKAKVPKRIHKAEREKLKREQLNDLFVELANSIDLSQPNNGKASILFETTRLVKDLIGQIKCLKKENASLLSESHYVTVEKIELEEENSSLETQIEKLQSELQTRVAQSKPDLNMPAPEIHHPELTPQYPATVDTSMPQTQAVFLVPLHPEAYPLSSSHVSKPHARYPTPADSWPSQLLAEQIAPRNEVQISPSNGNVGDNGELGAFGV